MKFRDNKSISTAKFAKWDTYYRSLVDTARSKSKVKKTKEKKIKRIKINEGK